MGISMVCCLICVGVKSWKVSSLSCWHISVSLESMLPNTSVTDLLYGKQKLAVVWRQLLSAGLIAVAGTRGVQVTTLWLQVREHRSLAVYFQACVSCRKCWRREAAGRGAGLFYTPNILNGSNQGNIDVVWIVALAFLVRIRFYWLMRWKPF